MGLRFLLLALVLATAADAQPRVTVRVAPETVRVGETVTYTLTIEGGRSGTVSAPPPSGGLAVSGATRDTQSTVNGRSERRVEWTYTATAPGEATLGSLTLRVGERLFTTDPVTVTVRAPAPAVPRGSGPLPAGDVAVRVEPERPTALVGQQTVVDVVLYAAPDTQPTETLALGAWSTPGFWREELDAGTAIGRTVREGGRERVAYVVERLALFPTRAGTLTIAPRRLRVSLVRYDTPDASDPFGAFFSPFRQRRETVVVESPAVTLRVTPPPAGAPSSFAGAVGDVTMERRVDRTGVGVDEPVRVTVTLNGTANLATLTPPDLGLPAGAADLFGPDDARTADRLGARLTATRTFTYTIVPTAGGRLVLPALDWSYYDPSAGAYVTRTAPAVTIRVAGGSAAAATAPALALRTRARWRGSDVPLSWLWGALALGLAVPLGTVGVQAARRAGRRRNARRAPAPPAPEHGVDYAGTERRIRRALADRLGVPPTTPVPRLAEALTAAGVDADAAARLTEIVATAQRGQFAPGLAGTPSPEALAAEATEALAALPSVPSRRPSLAPASAVLAFVLAAGTAHAQPPEALFRLGVQLVAEGDTAGAVAAWHGASTAATSADVAHNLGVVALAQGDLGRARLHLEHAARLAPLDAGTRAALTEVRQQTGASPPSRTAQAWALATLAGPVVPVGLTVALLLLATVAVLRRRRIAAFGVGALAALAGLTAVAALVEAETPRGVTVEATVLRTAPSPDAPEAGRVAIGQVVRTGDRTAGWQHVRADGLRGWAPAGSVARRE